MQVGDVQSNHLNLSFVILEAHEREKCLTQLRCVWVVVRMLMTSFGNSC